jgi:hypothetical protein
LWAIQFLPPIELFTQIAHADEAMGLGHCVSNNNYGDNELAARFKSRSK